jgi:hypothetical protein
MGGKEHGCGARARCGRQVPLAPLVDQPRKGNQEKMKALLVRTATTERKLLRFEEKLLRFEDSREAFGSADGAVCADRAAFGSEYVHIRTSTLRKSIEPIDRQ